jgi:flagellar motor switch protein FliG
MIKLDEGKREVFEALSMADKVAILLIKLGDVITTQVFSYLEVDIISEITQGIAMAKTVDQDIVGAVISEFYVIFQSNSYISSGGMDYAKELLFKTLPPEEAKRVLDKLARSMQKHENFAYLGKIKPQQIADFIVNEHPQTIALILAHMDSTSAAETMSYFQDEIRAEVSIRMANLGEIGPNIVRKVSTMLETKLESFAGLKVEVGGPRAVAEIFNRLGQQVSKTTLTYIEQIDDKLAESIKEMMFTFEDINKLDANAITEILKTIDNKDLALGLKGANDDLRDKFLSRMSQRAAAAFEEELGFLGAVKLKDVEAAQRKIVELVQSLAEQGTIEMGDDEEMVE